MTTAPRSCWSIPSPDLREQLLDAHVKRLDAVLFHARARRPRAWHRRSPAARHRHAPQDPGLCRPDDERTAADAVRLLLRNARRQRLSAHSDRAPPRSAAPTSIAGPGGTIYGAAVPHGPWGHGRVRVSAFGDHGLCARCEPDAGGEHRDVAGAWISWCSTRLRYTPHPTHFSVSEALRSSSR